MTPRQLKPAQLSPDQLECWKLVCDLVHGEHHAPDRIAEWGKGIKVSLGSSQFATFDFDYLSRLVFMAHDRCIRVELLPSGPGRIGVALWKRHTRDGAIHERHPTLRDAIGTYRRHYIEPME